MCIVDTVVLLYFMLVGREDLLWQLLGNPILVPVVVYDPEEQSLPPEAVGRPELLSEIRQAIRHYEVLARGEEEAAERLERLRRIDSMHAQRQVEAVALTLEERALAARLQSRAALAEFGLRVPLGPGEAACVAIAFIRGWTIATDDTDALVALAQLKGGAPHEYERIRKLLVRAREEGLLTPDEASTIHEEMKSAGFWDAGSLSG